MKSVSLQRLLLPIHSFLELLKGSDFIWKSKSRSFVDILGFRYIESLKASLGVNARKISFPGRFLTLQSAFFTLFQKEKSLIPLSVHPLQKRRASFLLNLLIKGYDENLVLHWMTFALSSDSQSFHLLLRFRLLKECNRLCEFWFILCIFMNINAFLISFTSLN